jgi:hypothetical protein
MIGINCQTPRAPTFDSALMLKLDSKKGIDLSSIGSPAIENKFSINSEKGS